MIPEELSMDDVRSEVKNRVTGSLKLVRDDVLSLVCDILPHLQSDQARDTAMSAIQLWTAILKISVKFGIAFPCVWPILFVFILTQSCFCFAKHSDSFVKVIGSLLDMVERLPATAKLACESVEAVLRSSDANRYPTVLAQLLSRLLSLQGVFQAAAAGTSVPDLLPSQYVPDPSV
jgi:hypothetical protein